jgi:predicted DNA-binding antitoxin AbrB/MazE fold protein
LITTIEGRIQNGVIVPMEPISISTGSRVLITILGESKDNKMQLLQLVR